LFQTSECTFSVREVSQRHVLSASTGQGGVFGKKLIWVDKLGGAMSFRGKISIASARSQDPLIWFRQTLEINHRETIDNQKTWWQKFGLFLWKS